MAQTLAYPGDRPVRAATTGISRWQKAVAIVGLVVVLGAADRISKVIFGSGLGPVGDRIGDMIFGSGSGRGGGGGSHGGGGPDGSSAPGRGGGGAGGHRPGPPPGGHG